MLSIDDKNIKLANQPIHVGKFTNKGNDVFNICIGLEFVNDDNINGYLNLGAGFEKVFLIRNIVEYILKWMINLSVLKCLIQKELHREEAIKILKERGE